MNGNRKEELNERDQIAQLVIDNVLDGIITINRKGEVESFNSGAEKIFQYSAEEVIGNNIKMLMPEPYKKEHDSYINNYAETGEAKIIGIGREVTGQRKDGSHFPMDLAVTEFFIGEEMHFVGITKDMTERRKTEEALDKATRENFENTVKNLQNLVFKLEKAPAGRPVYTLMEGYNAQEIGLSTSSTFNKTNKEIFPLSISKELDNYHAKAFEGETVTYEWAFAGKVFYITLSPIFMDNQVSEIVGSGVDITDRKKMEEALALTRDEALEASELKSQFLANMSHEIRTPMNGIIGMVDVLMNTSLDKEQLEIINVVERSAQSLLTIINDILDFSKMEAGKLTIEQVQFSPTLLVEGIAEILLPKARQKDISLLTYIDPSIPGLLLGDSIRIQQILLNLTDNAIKFTEKGSVLIRTILKKITDENIVVLHFSVVDTGYGLSSTEISSLFQPFTQIDGSITRKHGGTGLGLAISKRLVELMEGDIGVNSEKGEGSTFWFDVPFSLPESSPAAETDIDPKLENLRVIILNDHAEEREILEKYISSWGMENASFENGIDALAELQKEVNNNRPYDLAVVHLKNPGMDSQMFLQVIKQSPHLSKLDVILLGEQSQKEKGTDGYKAFLTAPVKQSQLFDCIANVARPLFSEEESTMKENLDTSHKGSPQTEIINKEQPILLVEDNPMNRKVAFFQLNKLGYQAEAVTNGKEALEAVKKQKYPLILMDIQMPEMDGIEATQEIRRLHYAVPIVAMTANAMKSDKENYLEAGMDDYLSKPVNLERLKQVLEHWMPDNGQPFSFQAENRTETQNPPINMENLQESYGDESLVKELLQMFLNDAPGYLENLRQAIEQKKSVETAEIAHSLKGSSAVLKAETFTRLSAVIQQAAKSGDWETVLSSFHELETHYKEMEHFIESL
ncbi:response regulator [Alkalicoccus saliphilus]|uniref:Circadian input-output histidine kinase CikA n=1 Tax=Alkalicoccus saliphilus TaxID=200989 RepID=A0A2T4U6T1_9BACI|nr:response regulator [Alkalicoccus saliphilus]PTL39099.1 hypothetical protein C6Y45_07930 [Alkalicoccus saliphilus]